MRIPSLSRSTLCYTTVVTGEQHHQAIEVNGLVDYLTWLVTSRKLLMPKSDGRCYEALVLEAGQAYTPQPLPDDVDRGPYGNCYENSLLMAVRHAGRLHYAEGWAESSIGLPIQHAWLVDADGNCYDPTWDDNLDRQYYGIAFDTDWAVGRAIDQDCCYGLLVNDWMHDNELLVDGIPDEARADL